MKWKVIVSRYQQEVERDQKLGNDRVFLLKTQLKMKWKVIGGWIPEIMEYFTLFKLISFAFWLLVTFFALKHA